MKLLFESFKSFINEQEQRLPQIYCDMDGVLVDFEQGVVDQINKDLQEISKLQDTDSLVKIRTALNTVGRERVIINDLKGRGATSKPVRDYMYRRVGDDATFWANLPWMPNGRELWAFIAPYKPHILTSPMQKGSEYGKAMWVYENLELSKEQKVHMSHEKYKFATEEDGRLNVLIDDWDKNIIPWAKARGIAIQHVDKEIGATISKLKKLGFS